MILKVFPSAYPLQGRDRHNSLHVIILASSVKPPFLYCSRCAGSQTARCNKFSSGAAPEGGARETRAFVKRPLSTGRVVAPDRQLCGAGSAESNPGYVASDRLGFRSQPGGNHRPGTQTGIQISRG